MEQTSTYEEFQNFVKERGDCPEGEIAADTLLSSFRTFSSLIAIAPYNRKAFRHAEPPRRILQHQFPPWKTRPPKQAAHLKPISAKDKEGLPSAEASSRQKSVWNPTGAANGTSRKKSGGNSKVHLPQKKSQRPSAKKSLEDFNKRWSLCRSTEERCSLLRETAPSGLAELLRGREAPGLLLAEVPDALMHIVAKGGAEGDYGTKSSMEMPGKARPIP